MKPITPHTAAQRHAPRQSIVWLLELVIDGEPWRAASRPLDFGGESWPARLTEMPRWTMQSRGEFAPGGAVGTEARVRVNDPVGAPDSLRSRLENAGPLGWEATLRLLWFGDGWTEGDAVTMLRGVLAGWEAAPGGLTLRLIDDLTWRAGRRVGRVLLPSTIGGQPSPLVGGALPIVFGRHADLHLEPLLAGIRTTLAEPLGVADASLRLTSAAGFPPAGTVQVGGEAIRYAALDPVQNRLGSEAVPIERGQNLMLHSRGEPVRLIPEEGFQWLVADHPCALVADARADGTALDPGSWTAELRDLGGVQAQIVRMERWPVEQRFEATARRRAASTLIGPEAYAVSAENTALNPELAVDSKSSSTSARLAAGFGRLAFRIDPRLGAEGRLLGRWQGASLRARYSATRLWRSTSQLLVRFKQGASVFQAAVPRPDLDEARGEVQAAPGETGAEVENAVGIREFELDLAPAIDAATGWSAFETSPAPEMQVEFVPDADDAEILIHDLELFVRYHAQISARDARTISARVEGWPGVSGEAIENPADAIETLLTDGRFAGLPPENLDATGLANLRDDLAALGMTFARRIAGPVALGDLLEEAAREAGAWLRAGGEKIGFAPADALPPPGGESLGDALALDPEADLRLAADPAALRSECFALTASGRLDALARPLWSRCEGSDGIDGSIPLVETLQWLAGGEGALAAAGERLRAAIREPALLYRQVFPLGAALLEPGDAVEADRPALGLLEAPGFVQSLELTGPARVRLTLRLPDAGAFCWSGDAQTFMRLFGFGRRVALFVEGAPAAALDRDGNLRLAGRLTEDAGFAPPPVAEAIVRVGGFVYWSFGDAASGFTPFLRFDAQGNAALNGRLREASALAFTQIDACHEAAPGRFSLAPGRKISRLEFRSADAVLHLAGTLTESARLAPA